MRNNYGSDTQYPTVNLAVRKSRLKLYNTKSELPTYFLNKGQEFQIELFNPTKYVMLAKIKLNGNAISNGGLVLQPGQRIFLERFLEENKKFLFETYQVDNIQSALKAIEENGDLSVDFYREKQLMDLRYNQLALDQDIFVSCRSDGSIGGGTSTISGATDTTTFSNGSSTTMSVGDDSNITNTSSNMTYSHDINLPEFGAESLGRSVVDVSGTLEITPMKRAKAMKSSSKLTGRQGYASGKKTKNMKSKRTRISNKPESIETGRVGKGSNSSQKLEQVDLDFEWNVYNTVSYKMLPISQKRYDAKEIVQKYCGDCGKKLKPRHKFCPNCGEEQ
jgi:hypothetical protein